MGKWDFEALGMLELDSMPRAIRAQDAALKRAAVTVLACAPVSPGKAILMLAGAVAEVEESLAVALSIAASSCIDRLLLPAVHPAVLEGIAGKRAEIGGAALGVFECRTAVAAVHGADGGLKATEVSLGRLHLASGYGGKAYFTLEGEQADVEAAGESVQALLGDGLMDVEVIARPHEELAAAAFMRPWPIEPT